MKLISLFFVGLSIVVGGCASPQSGDKVASSSNEESYVALGTSIPRKGPRRVEDQTLDLQQMENNRIMNNGTSNTP